MKKLFTFFLSLVASVGTIFAASGTCGKNLTWDLTNGVLTISGSGAMTNYYDYNYTDVPWFDYRSSIKSAIISEGVTSIGSRTFYDCWNLASVTIPNSVTSVGTDAFYGCTGLPIIDNLRYADTYLVEAADKKISSYTIKSGTKWIGDEAFAHCSSLTSVIIPNSVTSIGSRAFLNCSKLSSVTISNSVSEINYSAFMNCTNLKSIMIPNSVKYVMNSAFEGCSSLTSIDFPSGEIAVRERVFYGCGNLETITLPDSIEWIAERAFCGCKKLSSISIPSTLYYIYQWAFAGCEALTSITLDLSYIGEYAFSGCSNLTTVTIGNSVESIGERCFKNCANLQTITIGNGISIIEEIFEGCKSLQSISLGKNITSINKKAFKDCVNLNTVVWNIQNYPDCSSEATPFYLKENKSIVFDLRKQITSFSIGNSVKKIPAYLCYGMQNLPTITIGNNVNTIGGSAFSGCKSLSNALVIPNNVTSIGEGAFASCTKIPSITIGSNVKTIGSYAFTHCSNVQGELIIPNHVKLIGERAFFMCSNLTSLIIGNNVDSIGDSAFENCSQLKMVVWNAPRCKNSIQKYKQYGEWYQGKDENDRGNFSNIIFGKNNSITSFEFGDDVSEVPATLCCDMTNLKYVEVGKAMSSIGFGTFFNCTKLDSIFWNAEHYTNIVERDVFASPISGGIFGVGLYTPFYLTHYIWAFNLTPSQYCYNVATQIKSLVIGKDVKYMPNQLCKGMSNLENLTCLSVTPPETGTNVFGGVECSHIPLCVPAQSVDAYKNSTPWRWFKPIIAIEAIEDETIEVVVSTTENSVTFEWPSNEAVDTYTIELQKDGEQVAVLIFDYQGKLLSYRFAAPAREDSGNSRNIATQTHNGWAYVIPELEPGTEYSYTITAKGHDANIIYSKSGSFTTQVPQGIEDINAATKSKKIVRDSHIYILRGEHVYNAQGKMVK